MSERTAEDLTAFVASSAQVRVYCSRLAEQRAHKRLERFVRGTAERLAVGGIAGVEDLVQAAISALWDLDPSRVPPADDRWLRSSLYGTLSKIARAERAERGRRGKVKLNRPEGEVSPVDSPRSTPPQTRDSP